MCFCFLSTNSKVAEGGMSWNGPYVIVAPDFVATASVVNSMSSGVVYEWI